MVIFGESTEHWDSLLVYLIWTKLNKQSARELEKIRTSDERAESQLLNLHKLSFIHQWHLAIFFIQAI